MLNIINHCRLQKNDTPDTFAYIFDAKVAENVHQRSDKHSSNDQEWALFMLKNANLTPYMRDSIPFQLMTVASMRKEPVIAARIRIYATFMHDLTEAYTQVYTATD